MNENTYKEQWIPPSLPARYEKAVYEDVPESIRKFFETMKDTKKGIYIHGIVGTGKTHIAYALYQSCFTKSGLKGRFWNVVELLREMRLDYYREGSDKNNTEEEVLKYEGILFLDDIGAEKNSEWSAETLYMIINRRYNYQLPMIFTSNFNTGDLSTKINDQIASRIVETCDIVELTGGDKRLKM